MTKAWTIPPKYSELDYPRSYVLQHRAHTAGMRCTDPHCEPCEQRR